MKAQIFLSCGQNEKYGEKEIAEAILKRINDDKALGFECWLACEVQDLRDLRDVIFKRLEESDYFIFVDFKREELKKKQPFLKQLRRLFGYKPDTIHRGSLFTNQELAVASYIGLGDCVLLLQEEGVERDGVLNVVLANLKENATRFPSSERNVSALPNRVCNLIKKKLCDKEWSNKTRNTLALNVYTDTPSVDTQPFHIRAENWHYRKDARNCFVYLDEVENLETKAKINRDEKWQTTELKWAGTSLAAVRIAPKSYRIFDAFWLDKTANGIVMKFFHPPAPSATDYFPYKLGPARYRLTYSVVSENFAPMRKSFDFEFKSDLKRLMRRCKTGRPQKQEEQPECCAALRREQTLTPGFIRL